MLTKLLALVWASIASGLDGSSAEAAPPSAVEPPTIELAFAAIVTLVIYALLKRPPRHEPAAEAEIKMPSSASEEVFTTNAGDEPARGAA